MSASALEAPPSLYHRRFAVRFVIVYFGLYALPLPVLRPIAYLVGRFWLGLATLSTRVTGSGDTTIAYLEMAILLVIASVAAAAWAHRARAASDDRLIAWFLAFLRVALFARLVGYGLAKVVQTQFPPIDEARLMRPLGDMSPMGLLWTFMGFSRTYNFAVGLAETVGPLLLLFRRTATLGALVCMIVLSNVVLLNFTYDVPVKLYSVHLLLMAVIIASPDLRRLGDVLVLNRATAPRPDIALFASPKRARIAAWSVAGLAVLIVFSGLAQSVGYDRAMRNRQGMDGTYELSAHPGAAPTFWRRLVISRGSTFILEDSTGRQSRSHGAIDERARTITLDGTYMGADEDDIARVRASLRYASVDSVSWMVTGTVDTAAVQLTMRRTTRRSRLMTRGFHWIQEAPYNR